MISNTDELLKNTPVPSPSLPAIPLLPRHPHLPPSFPPVIQLETVAMDGVIQFLSKYFTKLFIINYATMRELPAFCVCT